MPTTSKRLPTNPTVVVDRQKSWVIIVVEVVRDLLILVSQIAHLLYYLATKTNIMPMPLLFHYHLNTVLYHFFFQMQLFMCKFPSDLDNVMESANWRINLRTDLYLYAQYLSIHVYVFAHAYCWEKFLMQC